MVVVMIPSNSLQFQYFLWFQQMPLSNLFPIKFPNIWQQHIFWVRFLWLKIIKNYISHLLKFVNQRPELSSNQMYYKMLRQLSKGSLISISSESWKIHLLINVLYSLSDLTFADNISSCMLWMSPCAISSNLTLCLSI